MLYFLENKMKLHGELNSQHNKTNNITAMQVKCDKAEIFRICERHMTNQKMMDNWGYAEITLPRHY